MAAAIWIDGEGGWWQGGGVVRKTIQHTQAVLEKLPTLPDQPGCYLMRNRQGRIIYIGKATSLRSRVGSYFHPSTFAKADPKLRSLIRSIDSFDFIPLRTEPEAALTESRLIKEYRPRYNILLKDDKRFPMLRLHPGEACPRLEAVRLRKDDGARYWGPFTSSSAAWATLEFVQRHFGLRTCAVRVPGEEEHKHCHNDILRFCAAPCLRPEDYGERVAEACAFLDGDRLDVLKALRGDMEAAAQAQDFEKAAALRDTYLLLLRAIRQRTLAQRTPQLKAEAAAEGLAALAAAAGLRGPPHRIECYDISNISGTLSVASGVVSIDGVPSPQFYRMYRIKTVEGANDPASMAEVIGRRARRAQEDPEKSPMPDLVIVDGGITQLRAARAALDALGFREQALVGLAERFEELYHDVENKRPPIRFERGSPALHVLQAIRDEAHRFALTYHRKLRARKIRESVLDDIQGVGPARKAALLRHFGSMGPIREAGVAELGACPGIGSVFAEQLWAALHPGG